MTERRPPDSPSTWGPPRSASAGPPESIEDAAISLDRASSLMADLGFIVFRTPPDSATPDSCLMVMIQDAPTTRHFDPEVASFWVTGDGRGRIREADHSTRPFAAPFSWGRIRLVDRLGARNSFVSFGGTVTAERVGNGALLLIFRTPAVIFRLPGHSQRADRLGEEVMSFFGRLLPILWRSPETERAVAGTPPLVLYGMFLLHTMDRISHSATLRDALASELPTLHRQLDSMTGHHPEQLRAAEVELATLGLGSPPS